MSAARTAAAFLAGGRVKVVDLDGLRLPGKPPFAIGDVLIVAKVSPTGSLCLRSPKPGAAGIPGYWRPHRFEPASET